MPCPLLALPDSGWDWGSVRVPPLTYAPSQASAWMMVPQVYVAKRNPTIYHSVQCCGHAARVKDLQTISLTVAMAGWWQPPRCHRRGNATGKDIGPLRPCYDCHKHVYAEYWKAFDIKEHPWAVSLLSNRPQKRHWPFNDDNSADSDDSSASGSSDVITVPEASPEIKLVHEASEDSDTEAMVLDADLDSDAPIQEASNQGQNRI